MSDPKYTLVEYVAADCFAVSNATKDSFVSEFAVGLRLRADCQADGLRLGSVTQASHDADTGRTLVNVLLDSGAVLTANLTWVLHGCVDPDALCSHTHAGPAQGGTLPAYVKADCSVPFVGGHIRAEGSYTGFMFTETGTDVAADAAKSLWQVDGGQISLLCLNDAETQYNTVVTVDRNGATPIYYTVTPPAIFSGGVTTGTINDQDVSSGIVTKAISPACGQCRLTLSGANLLLIPCDGWMLTIDNTPKIVPASGVSLAATGVANTTYSIYAYWSGSAMALEASTTAPTADARNATRVKTGNATRALVGMARTNAAGAWVDSITQRFVLSYYNRQITEAVGMLGSDVTTSANNGTEVSSACRAYFLAWGDECVDIRATPAAYVSSLTNPYVWAACSLDTTHLGFFTNGFSGTYLTNCWSCVGGNSVPSLGMHYATLFGGSSNGAIFGSTSTITVLLRG